ncbi:uncharacterized protein KY384_005837 [Bacidia gigantensis]|uniref:uncharacterized protein n=1 Tax=Bacidia gigantensis TaxID=2732470 RepID=UPI001D051A9B|nr:uncharacterized protein KY384_005837 [Bacidia gigantensis]KAG8529202.1 hypothetical protein KY384_005837 [Bacidia gigantensis]
MMESTKRKASPPSDLPVEKKLKKQWRNPKKPQQQRSPPATIEPGDAGIWVTCAKGKEGKSTIEVRDLFEDYALRLYNHLGNTDADTSEAPPLDDDDEGQGADDIEALLKGEIKDIKQSSVKSSSKNEAVFQTVKLDTQCVLFFKTKPPIESVNFVHKICQDARGGVTQKRCRFVKRFTPMSRMAKATISGLESVCDYVLADGIGVEGTKYAIRPTLRDHNVLKRDEIIQLVARMVAQSGPSYKVDLKNPDVVVLVEVYRNVLGMSVVPGEFERLKRYNLAEILEPTPTS